MNEYKTILELFPDVKDLFKSDAQLVTIGGEVWGITCDTFSLKEDLFTADDPVLLGRNLVAATLSDLAATGCRPSFFMHAISFAKDSTGEWNKGLADGIREALNEAGCMLVGGDTGQADDFSYTGVALGPQVREVSRVFKPVAQNLYITGIPGAANAAVLTGAPTPAFKLHGIPPGMLAGIDTSGGFADALWQLHEVNPGFRIEAMIDKVDDIRLLFGGAGEYELLFTSNDPEAERHGMRIGMVTPSGDSALLLNGVPLTAPPPDARSFCSLSDYMIEVSKVVYELFGLHRS